MEAEMTIHEVLTQEKQEINTLAREEGLPAGVAAEIVAGDFDVIEFIRVLDKAARI
jgi:hypothetical protein